MGRDSLSGSSVTGQRVTAVKQKRGDLDKILGGIFHSEGGEALAQAAQRSGGCLIFVDVQGWMGPTHSDPMEAIPIHSRGVRTNDL